MGCASSREDTSPHASSHLLRREGVDEQHQRRVIAIDAIQPQPRVADASFDTLNATLGETTAAGGLSPTLVVAASPLIVRASAAPAGDIVDGAASAASQPRDAPALVNDVAKAGARCAQVPRLTTAALEEHTRREILLLHERIAVGGPMVMGQPRDWREVLEQWAMGVVLPPPEPAPPSFV